MNNAPASPAATTPTHADANARAAHLLTLWPEKTPRHRLGTLDGIDYNHAAAILGCTRDEAIEAVALAYDRLCAALGVK